MSEKTKKALFYHRLIAGLGLVMLAVVWASGWFLGPGTVYNGDSEADPRLLLLMTTLILASWNLLSCVIAAGFFHAANKHTASTFEGYKLFSLLLVLAGILFLFPVPLMTGALGSDAPGRAMALLVTGISMAGIAFGRARLRAIGERLEELLNQQDPEIQEEPKPLAPF